jgi:hypothetical protein
MAVQIIPGAETLGSQTVWVLANERLSVAEVVFPIHISCSPIQLGVSYFSSDLVLTDLWHEGQIKAFLD